VIKKGAEQMKVRTKMTYATLAASLLAGAIGSAALAQSTPLTRFDNGYLDEHPEVARQLAAHPALVDNSQFMATHPELREYFTQHPAVRADFKEHPYRFMAREDRLDARPNPNAPIANADRYYLDRHPLVARQVDQNPKLIDNPEYMEHHPELREFLRNHPYARAEWKSHPYRFERREDRYDRNH
jgi:hypothetical protein